MIRLTDVTKSYGDSGNETRAVRGIGLEIPKGSFHAIMGPSGSGKSTILHLIAGLTSPTSGAIEVHGVRVDTLDEEKLARLRREQVGYVMQSFNLLPFCSTADNIAMPLVLQGLQRSHVQERVIHALEQVGMVDRAEHRPGQLSGGEQQRVAIARALAINPTVLLADEPTGSLDQDTGRAVISLLRDINEACALTVLMVTHDPVFAAYSDRITRLVDGRVDSDMILQDTEG